MFYNKFYVFFFLIYLSFYSFVHANTNTKLQEQIKLQEQMKLLKELKQYYKLKFSTFINAANKCIKKRDFECSKEKLNKSKKYMKTKDDEDLYELAYQNISNELGSIFLEYIDAANDCTYRRKFRCANEKLEEAEKYIKTDFDKKEFEIAKANYKDEKRAQRREREEEEELEEERRRAKKRAREEEDQREYEARRAAAYAQPSSNEVWNSIGSSLDERMAEIRSGNLLGGRVGEMHQQRMNELNEQIRQDQRRKSERAQQRERERENSYSKRKEELRQARLEERNKQREKERKAQRAESKRKQEELRKQRIAKQKEERKKREQEETETVYEASAFVWSWTKNGTKYYKGYGPTQRSPIASKNLEDELRDIGCPNPRWSRAASDGEHDGKKYYCNTPVKNGQYDIVEKWLGGNYANHIEYKCKKGWKLGNNGWRTHCTER